MRAACAPNPYEPSFRSILPEIFRNLPRGSIVDAGAHYGGEACAFAELAPTRTVHAFEPIVANIRAIERRYANRTNLKLVNAGLGSTARRWDLNTPRGDGI